MPRIVGPLINATGAPIIDPDDVDWPGGIVPAMDGFTIPHWHKKILEPNSVESEEFVDVPGSDLTILMEHEAFLFVLVGFCLQTVSGGSASTIEVAANIDGIDGDTVSRRLSGSSDVELGMLLHVPDEPTAIGEHALKLRFRRTSGNSVPGITRSCISVLGLYGLSIPTYLPHTIPAEDGVYHLTVSGGVTSWALVT